MCGVVGIAGNNVGEEIRLALYGLQHRGEQGAGIVLFNGQEDYWVCKGSGLVTEVFSEEVIARISGDSGIGEVRYSTIGNLKQEEIDLNVQPLCGEFKGEHFYVAHNGNLIALRVLREEAEKKGYCFKTNSDTEVIVGLLSVSNKKDFIEAILEVLPRLEGAFSLVILYKTKVIGVRDKFGIRPLCLGRNESSYILASESCAFQAIQASFLYDIQPGELIILDEDGINQDFNARPFIWAEKPQLKICIFEFVYFARPDSVIDGRTPYSYRKEAGQFLAQDSPVDADIVIKIPDSGQYYDIGFSEDSNIPLKEGIFRNRYFAKRTFLTQEDVDRVALQRIKLRPFGKVVKDKRLIVVDDSLIRGNVALAVVGMLREAGAREIHLRIGSSPVCSTCHLGVDIATKGELVAASLSIEEIRKYIGADSLAYLSQERMIEASGFERGNLTMGCFGGEYAGGLKG
ncbi:MAG: amidophosphoribosyltransferase [Patescibacteria group bacterium]